MGNFISVNGDWVEIEKHKLKQKNTIIENNIEKVKKKRKPMSDETKLKIRDSKLSKKQNKE